MPSILPAAALQALSLLAPPTHAQKSSNTTLPSVDLGYSTYPASSLNSTTNLYRFDNIRYAAPPTGDLRFRAPEAPSKDSSDQTDRADRICAQGAAPWQAIAGQFIPRYLGGETEFNQSSFQTSSGGRDPDPRVTEDCLFLDVVVPEDVFSGEAECECGGAAVVVWIHGGGYAVGSKAGSGDPSGLIERSRGDEGCGIIYVSMNYRLGAFGWLVGPTFQEDGTANAGLYDQRLALEWVQDNIAKFGGNPDRVTVLGESAGAGSIMAHITAFGGEKPAPFARAVAQSLGIQPIVSEEQKEDILADYLGFLGVDSIEEARGLPYEELVAANTKQTASSPYGQFTYGLAVDGNYVPAMPGKLMLEGSYDKSVSVLTSHNQNEGLLFTSPYTSNDTAFENQIKAFLPGTRDQPDVIKHLTQDLYPAEFDGSQSYTTQLGRLEVFISEMIFTCHAYFLNKAFDVDETHSYLFAIPPSLHTDDVPYTYFDGPSEDVEYPEIAKTMQTYITNFAMTGDPNGEGVPEFPVYGSEATMQKLAPGGVSQTEDPQNLERCEWWQQVKYA